jgi:hypothetical protein
VLYLPNKSLSSCSETNCPKLATNKVEHGGVEQLDDVADPTGLAKAVLAATKCEGGIVAWIAAWLAKAAAWLIGWGTANCGYRKISQQLSIVNCVLHLNLSIFNV